MGIQRRGHFSDQDREEGWGRKKQRLKRDMWVNERCKVRNRDGKKILKALGQYSLAFR